MEKLGPKLDKVWVGLIAGILGPIPGFLLVMVGLMIYTGRPFERFLYIALNYADAQPSLIAVSLLFDLLLFLLVTRYDWYRAARGIVMAAFLYAPVVIYLRYLA